LVDGGHFGRAIGDDALKLLVVGQAPVVIAAELKALTVFQRLGPGAGHSIVGRLPQEAGGGV
jgi:hypothetical protein